MVTLPDRFPFVGLVTTPIWVMPWKKVSLVTLVVAEVPLAVMVMAAGSSPAMKPFAGLVICTLSPVVAGNRP